ncbi:MAG: hypothetical protein IJ364_00975 [Oscillospiraceae bacterium]|nr:hypothetical protein [Oscillospiraceae bacterium]
MTNYKIGSVLKGYCRNIIVVKSPSPMFSEAIFILKDELFTGSKCDSRDILKQAEEAARSYSSGLSGHKGFKFNMGFLLCPLLGFISAALSILILK